MKQMKELYSGNGWMLRLEDGVLPDGRKAQKARAKFADIVHVLPFNDDGKILILREFRPFYGNQWIWQLVSGHVDKETDIVAAAQRELQEEAGYKADDLKFLWTGRIGEKFIDVNHFFVAKQLVESSLEKDHDEMMEVHFLEPKEALDKILNSPEVHMPSAYGLMRYLHDQGKF